MLLAGIHGNKSDAEKARSPHKEKRVKSWTGANDSLRARITAHTRATAVLQRPFATTRSMNIASMWPFTASANTAKQDVLATKSEIATPIATEHVLPVAQAGDRAGQRQEKLERQEWLGYSDERLGIIPPLRAILLMGVSFLSGASLGAATGSAIAADRYRAENAHRLPTTQNGWFFYHKSKNYHAMLGGMKEGGKFGGILTGWAFLFMATEEMIDQSRARIFARKDDERATGQRDAASTVISAMSVAGIYSWRQGFDQYAAARTAKLALKYSLLFGLAQDALATLRGSRPAYIDWLARKAFRGSSQSDSV